MTHEQLFKTFLLGAKEVVEPDSNNTIAIGEITPSDVPEGVFFVMHQHTQEIDALIQSLPYDSPLPLRLELYGIRGFTYQEFLMLYERIQPKDFKNYPIFQCLFIKTEQQRRRYLALYPQKTYEQYLQLLYKVLEMFSPHSVLVDFFFTLSNDCTHLNENAATALLSTWSYRGW